MALTDIADIVYEDSPAGITRKNKQYQATITGSFTDEVSSDKEKTEALKKINEQVVNKYLNSSVTRAKNSVDESMYEEFSALFKAIAIAIFLYSWLGRLSSSHRSSH